MIPFPSILQHCYGRSGVWQTQKMVDEQESGRYLLPVLMTGFALLIILLLASGWVAVDSMRFVESDASRFVSEHQATARLIEEVQSEEGNLSNVFYSLAAGSKIDRAVLLRQLDALEAAVHRTIKTGEESGNSRLWRGSFRRRYRSLFTRYTKATLRRCDWCIFYHLRSWSRA